MKLTNAEQVRLFILNRYSKEWKDRNLKPENITDTYDLLGEGIIDSLGLLQLVSAIEEEFDVEIDFEDLEPEQITILGSLAHHVERAAQPRSGQDL